MSVSSRLKQLNHYPEWQNLTAMVEVRDWVEDNQNGHLPDVPAFFNHSENSRRDFIRKFDNDDWSVDNRGNLIYSPPTVLGHNHHGDPIYGPPRIRLFVIPPNRRQLAMQQLYDNDRKGLGVGVNQWYYQVCMNYLGIRRKETTEFLKKQGDYQVTRNFKHGVNHPIISKTPNERWQVDVLHMDKYGDHERQMFKVLEHNKNYPDLVQLAGVQPAVNTRNNRNWHYVLTVVDCFCGYLFGEAMHTLDSLQTTYALQRIIQRAGVYPRIVQTDNGPEFDHHFRNYIDQLNAGPHRCSLVHSRPHSPQDAGQVERANQMLRAKFREAFVRHNDLEWVAHLQDFIYNINHQKPSRSRFTPADLWEPAYIPPPNGYNPEANIVPANDETNLHQIRDSHIAKKITLARDQTKTLPTHVFRIGDYVRISVRALYPEIRARHKQGFENKLTTVRYTPTLYEVLRVQPALQHGPVLNFIRQAGLHQFGYRPFNLQRPKYLLRNLTTGDDEPRWFYGSDLIYCGDRHHPPVQSTLDYTGNPNAGPLPVNEHAYTLLRSAQLNRIPSTRQEDFSYYHPYP